LRAYLTPRQRALFSRMPPRDQRHSLDVFHALVSRGCKERDLLVAALLHDVGKGHLPLWCRIAVVLISAVKPSLLDWLAANRPGSWRYPFYLHREHGRRGAMLARKAGCSALTVELIRRHHDPLPPPSSPLYRLLALFQEADGAC